MNERSGRATLVVNAWPGWVAAGICAFWLTVWAVLMPPDTTDAQPAATAGKLAKPDDIAGIPSAKKLNQLFARIHYSLDAVRDGDRAVPPLFLVAVPEGLHLIEQVDVRKRLFLRFMLPLVLRTNEHVMERRERLLDIRERRNSGETLSDGDRKYLAELAKEYGLKDKKAKVDALLQRVDVVPPSIALAQSAIESGWGTSRFAVKGNAAFGQWTTADYEGLIPQKRPEGESYKVRTFRQLEDSVRSYLHNINTHGAYLEFRRMRAKMRAAGKELESLKLVSTLTGYSEKGANYVQLLRQVIDTNRLEPFDKARLDERIPQLGPDA